MSLLKIIFLYSSIFLAEPKAAEEVKKKVQDIITERILFVEEVKLLGNKSLLASEMESGLIKRELLKNLMKIKDIHLSLIDEFRGDKKDYKDKKIYSLKSQIEIIDNEKMKVKVVLFDENAQKIIQRVKSKTVDHEKILYTFSRALDLSLLKLKD